MINPDYPQHDPTWDYAQPYEELQKHKSDLDHFIAWLASYEEADREIDRQAKTKLDQLINQLTEIRKIF